MNDLLLYEALKKRGIPYPKEDVVLGKFTRWGDNKKYWVIKFVGGYSLGDFSEDFVENIFEKNYDYETCKHEIKAIQKKLSAAKKRDNELAAAEAKKIWDGAKNCETHSYLEKKQIESHGLKTLGEMLLIPVYDEYSNLVSLQKIWENPDKNDDEKFIKRFLANGKTKGCYFTIGKIDDEVVICEGYATGATIYKCVEKAVVVAFYCGNILDAAKIIRKKYPRIKIIIAADNDQHKAVNSGVLKANEAAESVGGIVVKPQFKDLTENPTDFNDLQIAEGEEAVRKIFAEAKQRMDQLENFELTEEGLFYRDNHGRQIFISDYIHVIAATREYSDNVSGKLLELRIRENGRLERVRILSEWLSTSGDLLRTHLTRMGFVISTRAGCRNLFNEYLNLSRTEKVITYLNVNGWTDNIFVLPNKIIGNWDEEFETESIDESINQKGTLDEWKENVAKYCVGNSRLTFSVCLGFASLLLKICDVANCGFNLVGQSSTGKTTCLKVAASIFGNPKYINVWRSTDNALETLAFKRNDMLLILDEIGLSDANKIGDISYMFSSGQGKHRLDKNCNQRKLREWRLLLLSTGEIDLATHMAEARKVAKAGQEIRLLDIPSRPKVAEHEKTHGVFENIHDFKSGGHFSKYLASAAANYYGTPLLEFLNHVMKNKAKIKADFSKRCEELEEKFLPQNACEQDNRAFQMFVFACFAGELATKYGITGWDSRDSYRAAMACFASWLEKKGGAGNHEEKTIIEQLRLFLSLHGQSRFQRLIGGEIVDEQKIINRAGYVEMRESSDVFYIFPDVFRREIYRGFDITSVEDLLIKEGFMIIDRDGKRLPKKQINGIRARMYSISSEILGETV
jgi:putative DNA primase/helicase